MPSPVKDWPAFRAPGDASAGPVQLKSLYVAPDPVSWREAPAGVLEVSSTPMSVLVWPLAGPLVAVKAPS